MKRETISGKASVKLLCETFSISRAAYYAEARRQRGEVVEDSKNVVALPKKPRYTSTEVVLLRIREVLAREACAAWGVRKGMGDAAARSAQGLAQARACHHAGARARARA